MCRVQATVKERRVARSTLYIYVYIYPYITQATLRRPHRANTSALSRTEYLRNTVSLEMNERQFGVQDDRKQRRLSRLLRFPSAIGSYLTTFL